MLFLLQVALPSSSAIAIVKCHKPLLDIAYYEKGDEQFDPSPNDCTPKVCISDFLKELCIHISCQLRSAQGHGGSAFSGIPSLVRESVGGKKGK